MMACVVEERIYEDTSEVDKQSPRFVTVSLFEISMQSWQIHLFSSSPKRKQSEKPPTVKKVGRSSVELAKTSVYPLSGN